MSVFLAPAKAMMNRLKTSQKMVLISVVFLIPLMVCVAIMVANSSADISKSEAKRHGLAYIKALRQLVQHVPEHRGMTNAFLNGNQGLKDKILAKRSAIQADIDAVDAFDDQSKTLFQTHEAWLAWKKAFTTLRSEAFDGPAPEVFSRHSALINDLKHLIRETSDQTGLSFTEQRNSFYMVKLVVENIPVLTDDLGILRGLGSGVAAAGSMMTQQESRLADLRLEAVNEINLAKRNLEAVTAQNGDRATRVEAGLADFSGKFEKFISLVDDDILSASESFSKDNESALLTLMSQPTDQEISLDADSDQVFQQGTAVIRSAFTLFDLLLQEVDTQLADNQSVLKAYRVALVLGALLSIAFAIYMFIGFYASILAAVQGIQSASSRLAQGDLTARVKLESQDELGEIAKAFNDSAESFSRVLSDFAQANQRLLTSSAELSEVARTTGKGAQVQEDQTELLASSMEEMSATVSEVAKNAVQTAGETNSARAKAVDGGQRIHRMIGEINELSGQVDEAAEVVQALDKDVESISSVLDVIHSISEQTNLLALNAAIEAARAGEHGRGFAVVADEVRGLAGRTQEATAEIQDMTLRLQSVAQQASAVMKSSSKKTEVTVSNAGEAETAVNGIVQAVETIDDMSSQIASAAEEQSMVAEEINRNIHEIRNVVTDTTHGVKQTATRCEELDSVAKNLQAKIARFKY